MLKIQKLNAGYNELQILSDVSLELKPETISILMGPNGAGKSTLLKSIFNLTEITSGTIEFGETNITTWPAHKLLKLGIAYVAQNKINFAGLTVKDNLLMGVNHIRDAKLIQKLIEEMYHHFPVLKEKQNEYAFTLSGGQQQLLAIARALMSSPKLLLLDEPTLGLSPKLVKEIFDHIVYIRNTFKTTILVVEHNLKSLMDIADCGYVMIEGKIVAHNTCASLKQDKIMEKVFSGTFE